MLLAVKSLSKVCNCVFTGSLGAAITLLSQFSEVERMKAFEGASGSVVYQLPGWLLVIGYSFSYHQ